MCVVVCLGDMSPGGITDTVCAVFPLDITHIIKKSLFPHCGMIINALLKPCHGQGSHDNVCLGMFINIPLYYTDRLYK